MDQHIILTHRHQAVEHTLLPGRSAFHENHISPLRSIAHAADIILPLRNDDNLTAARVCFKDTHCFFQYIFAVRKGVKHLVVAKIHPAALSGSHDQR